MRTGACIYINMYIYIYMYMCTYNTVHMMAPLKSYIIVIYIYNKNIYIYI